MTSEPTSAKQYTIIVARKGDEFLMVRHATRGWELPGGGIEDGEGPVHCALREFREETGHLLGDPKFVMKIEKANGICFVFTGRLGAIVGGKEDDVIQEMAWMSQLPEELAFPDDPYEEMGRELGMSFR